jgi:hypothetical protein
MILSRRMKLCLSTGMVFVSLIPCQVSNVSRWSRPNVEGAAAGFHVEITSFFWVDTDSAVLGLTLRLVPGEGIWILRPNLPATIHSWDSSGNPLGEEISAHVVLSEGFSSHKVDQDHACLGTTVPKGARFVGIELANYGVVSSRFGVPDRPG